LEDGADEYAALVETWWVGGLAKTTSETRGASMSATDRIDRRHFLGAAAMTMTAARLGATAARSAPSNPASSFGVLNQIDAGEGSIAVAFVHQVLRQ
jgi:hypothetical protein